MISFRTLAKYFGRLVGALVVVLAALLVFSQTGLFRDWLRKTMIRQANAALNASLSIDTLEGNLITSLSLRGVRLISAGDTVLSLPELALRLEPGALLRNTVKIKVIALENPQLLLRQLSDSSWNVSELVQAQDNPPQEADAASDWTIQLESTRISNGHVRIFSRDSSRTPLVISNINSILSLRYTPSGSELTLKKLQLHSLNPDLVIDHLGFRLGYAAGTIVLENLSLRTADSRMSGSISFNPESEHLQAELQARPLNLADIRSFYPDIPAPGRYSVDIEAQGASDSLDLSIALRDSVQHISLQASFSSLRHNHPGYEAELRFENVLVKSWYAPWSTDDRLSGTAHIRGHGIAPDSIDADFSLHLADSRILGRSSGSLSLQAALRHGSLDGRLNLAGAYGDVRGDVRITELFGRQSFAAALSARKLDLAPVLSDPGLSTELTFTLRGRGEGFAGDAMVGTAEFHMAPSTALEAEIDTAFARVSLDRGRIRIDTVQVRSPLAAVYLAGKINLSAENDLRFHGSLGDLRWVQKQISADTLHARGTFAGLISGPSDSLLSKLTIDLHDIRFDSIKVDTLRSTWQHLAGARHQHGRGRLTARGFAFGTTRIDTIDIRAGLQDSLFSAGLALGRRDSIAARARVVYEIKKEPRLLISDVRLRIRDLRWSSDETPATVVFGDSALFIENVSLRSEDQWLAINGTLAQKGRQDLSLRAKGVDLQPITRLFGLQKDLDGELDLGLRFTGTAEQPLLNGTFTIRDGRVMEFRYQHWRGNFDYKDGLLSWTFNLLGAKDRELNGDGYLPLMLHAGADSLIDMHKPIRIHVITGATGGFDLSFLQTLTDQFRNISGEFSTNLLIGNTLANPWPVGSIRIYNGKFDFPRYGARYRNILITLQVDTTRIDVRQFKIGGLRGDLRINGVINYHESGIQGGISSAELVAKARNFVAAKNRDFEVVIDGDARLGGPLESPRFGGTINIKRSTFYIPAFEDNRYIELEQLQPLLAQATLDTILSEEIHTAQPSIEEPEEPVSDYYKNLRGELKIIIPRNTWLRGPEMNVEIAGELDIVKQGEEFDMPFGTIQVIRGTYELYGRRFKIKSGSFTFDGGEEIDPLIDIEAEYVFRDAYRNSSLMLVHITGRAYKPQVRFYLNDIEIAEVEAASYIIFGRNIEDLSQNERETLSGSSSGESSAFSLLTQLGAAQLSKTIGKRLNLDVIEFQGREESGASSILVGRYLTNNIFISVQQQLDSRQWHNLWNATATMEIEVMRNLLLQLTKGSTENTTGFDLIWKFQK